MSDEESFVILGSCSLRSDESLRSDFASLERSKIEMDNVESGTANLSLNDSTKNNESPKNREEQEDTQSKNLETSTEKEKTMTESVNKDVPKNNMEVKDSSFEVFEKTVNKVMQKSSESEKSVNNANSTAMNRSTSSGDASVKTNGSLAASFLLGEVQADVLKSSVYSQFPSLCSMESSAEDITKLQNFMSEYIELKTILNTVNGTMRQFYHRTQQWRDEMKKTERQYKEQLQNCKLEIATLRNENLNLRQEMLSKMEHMHVCEESQQKEITLLTQSISEKTALIDNMRSQIARLEEQQLASFDYISKHENDTKDSPEYIARSEHLLAIKELERKMSAIVAENYELQDMKKVYIDEINCLRVNLTSAEELLQQARGDIEMLKSEDLKKSQLFENYEKEREQLREEMGLLRHQVEMYSKDFQMERTARESLAGEKEQLVQDLRVLQRTNQQLIEEQQRRLENINTSQVTTSNVTANNVASVTAPPATPPQRLPEPTPAARKPPSRFSCPICSNGFESLTVLQSHVNMCLDNA